MPVVSFMCEQCGTVDIDTSIDSSARICTRCSTGEWHGLFEEEHFDPDTHHVNNASSSDDPFSDEGPSFG